jgi:hypothetical protein
MIETRWNEWKQQDPKEFADRGRSLESDIRRELDHLYYRYGRSIPVVDPSSHPVYHPSRWNDAGGIQHSTNCYAYACNDPYNHPRLDKPQPGALGGITVQQAEASAVRFAVMGDDMARKAKMLQHLIPLIRLRNDPVPAHAVNVPGYYLIALVTAPGVDYHWVRQDNDGTWSHKPGWEKATCFDSNGLQIYDPRQAAFTIDYRAAGGRLAKAHYAFTTFYYAPRGGVRTGDLGTLRNRPARA